MGEAQRRRVTLSATDLPEDSFAGLCAIAAVALSGRRTKQSDKGRDLLDRDIGVSFITPLAAEPQLLGKGRRDKGLEIRNAGLPPEPAGLRRRAANPPDDPVRTRRGRGRFPQLDGVEQTKAEQDRCLAPRRSRGPREFGDIACRSLQPLEDMSSAAIGDVVGHHDKGVRRGPAAARHRYGMTPDLHENEDQVRKTIQQTARTQR